MDTNQTQTRMLQEGQSSQDRELLCSSSDNQTPAIQNLSRFDKKGFLLTFNPSNQAKFCETPEHCILSEKAPTLAQIRKVYGDGTPQAWLVPQLTDLTVFCGCKGKLEDMQYYELANIICQEFFWLKNTELMLFFWWFKTGKYGQFYGTVDPMLIMTKLRVFIRDDRNRILEEDEHRRATEERAKEQREGITFEEWAAKQNGKTKITTE